MTARTLGLQLPTGPLLPGLWAIRDGLVNLFVLAAGEDLVCVDAGRTPRSVGLGFRRLHLDPARVCAVLLTHSDRDHVGGLPFFPRARVYAGEGERALVTGVTTRFLGLFRNPRPAGPWNWVRGGEVLRFGDRSVEVVPAPGHTPGSVCYRVGRLLFVGDALWFCGGPRPLLRPLNMDHRRAWRSVRLLTGLLGVERVLTAHSGWGTP